MLRNLLVPPAPIMGGVRKQTESKDKVSNKPSKSKKETKELRAENEVVPAQAKKLATIEKKVRWSKTVMYNGQLSTIKPPQIGASLPSRPKRYWRGRSLNRQITDE